MSTDPEKVAGAYERFIKVVQAHPTAAIITAPILFSLLLLFVVWLSAPDILQLYERMNDRDYERQVVLEDDRRDAARISLAVDDAVRARLRRLRFQSRASRAVVRAFVFDMDQQEQLLGIEDVFESMDIPTEETGLRNVELPLAAIQQTMNFMLASDSPRCIARNAEDYADPRLRSFLQAGGLKASVACPLRDMGGDPVGLLAVSIRTRLEDNPQVIPLTRDASLELGPILPLAKEYQRAIMEAQPADD